MKGMLHSQYEFEQVALAGQSELAEHVVSIEHASRKRKDRIRITFIFTDKIVIISHLIYNQQKYL